MKNVIGPACPCKHPAHDHTEVAVKFHEIIRPNGASQPTTDELTHRAGGAAMTMRAISMLVSHDEYDELAALGVVHAAHAERLGGEPFRPETVAASVIARALAGELRLFHLPRASEEPL